MIIPKTKNRKRLFIITSFVFLLVACGTLYLYGNQSASLFGWNPFTSSREQEQKRLEKDQQQAGQSIKERSIANGSSGSDQPPSPTPSSDGKSVVDVVITAANQNSSLLQIRVDIATLSSGVCTLTLSKSGHADITKTAATQSLSNTSTCQGFDIPVSELSPGEWTIKVQYESPSLTGTTTHKIRII